MKKLFELIVFVLTAHFSLFAADGDKITKDGMIFTVLSESSKTASVKMETATSLSGAVTIPSSITNSGKTYTVTTIASLGFLNCNNITSVTIPSSVTTIKNYAFQSCASLESVSIPSSTTMIEMGAFSECAKLTKISIDSKNQNYVSVDNVIFNKDKTTLVQFPTGVTGNYTIPSTVTTLIQSSFSGNSLTSVTLPAALTTIGAASFAKSNTLSSILVDSKNSTFCSVDGVLMNKAQTLLIQYPGGKKGFYAIPSTITSLQISSFEGCSELTAIEFPSSITTIPEWTFGTCTKLTSIVIPASVTSIELRAFTGCTSLTKIYDTNPTPQTLGQMAFNGVPADAEIFVPEGSKSAYASASGWSAFSNFTEIKMAGETFTDNGLTYTITNIESPQVTVKAQSSDIAGDVVIPARASNQSIYYAVKSIEASAFENCSDITSIEIPVTVTTIGADAFKNCNAIDRIVNYNPTPQPLGSDAFSGVSTSAELYVEEGCKSAFEAAAGWDKFTNVTELRQFEVALSETEASVEAGKTLDLTTDISKTFDVEIESQSWTSSDPEVATVDQTGQVTGVAVGKATITYSAVDNYNRTTSATCQVTVTEAASITDINTDYSDEIDFSEPYEVFTINGQKLNLSIDQITAGIYLIRQGKHTKKIVVE